MCTKGSQVADRQTLFQKQLVESLDVSGGRLNYSAKDCKNPCCAFMFSAAVDLEVRTQLRGCAELEYSNYATKKAASILRSSG